MKKELKEHHETGLLILLLGFVVFFTSLSGTITGSFFSSQTPYTPPETYTTLPNPYTQTTPPHSIPYGNNCQSSNQCAEGLNCFTITISSKNN